MKRVLLAFILLLLTGHAWCTVVDRAYSISFTCAGGLGPFPFQFSISDPTALVVTVNGVVQNPANYTVIPVNNNYDNGGNVTLGSMFPCMAGWILTLSRDTPQTQASKFYDNMPTPMQVFENGLDKLTEIVQEIWGGTVHTIQFQNGGVNADGPLKGDIVVDLNGCTANVSGQVATLTCTGVASNPAGSDTEIMFNRAGVFGGDARLIFNYNTGTFALGSGSSGDPAYRAWQTGMHANGQFLGDFLTSTGSTSDTLHQLYINTWFRVGPGNPSFAQGIWGMPLPLQSWLMTGGPDFQGTPTTWQMPDPTTGIATVTPQGGTGGGADYCLYFIDANEQNSAPLIVSSTTAFSSPNGSTWNKILYNQDQGVGKYGGSWSNLLISRITHGAGPTACATHVLNNQGQGVISQFQSCTNNVTYDGQCEIDDKGQYTTTSLATLQAIFAGSTGYENTTGGLKVPYRSWIGFGSPGGTYLAGGNQVVGRTTTQQISAPSGSYLTITNNTSGATTYTYAAVVHDYAGGATTIGADVSTSTGNATRNNNVAFAFTAYCSSVDLYLHSGGSYYTLTGSTGLPCYATNSQGDFGTKNAFTFVDNNLSTTITTTPATNTTGDMVLASGSNFISLAGNSTTGFSIWDDAFSGHGWCQGDHGDATHIGGVTCFDHTGTLQYTLGTDLESNNVFSFAAPDGGAYNFTANIDVGGGKTIDTSQNIFAGGGSNVVYRCATAGATLPVGSLTINAAACGTTADTGLRTK